jgi:hypothetical protein
MSQKELFLSDLQYLDQEYFTPELFALKLLMDTNNNYTSLDKQLQTFTDYDENNDPTSFFFEIVLTIFMELFFGILKLNHFAENDSNNTEEEFDPIMESDTVEDLLPIISEKFNKIGLIVSIFPTEINDYTKKIIDKEIKNRYCRIIYRNNESDENYFDQHEDEIDEDKMYHMILNGNFKKNNNLNDLYATWTIDDKYYKISFKKIEIFNPLYKQI